MEKSSAIRWLAAVAAICLSLMLYRGRHALSLFDCKNEPSASAHPEILPVEDLMREHGLLNRLLLIYEELIKRQEQNKVFPLDVLSKTIAIMHSFIEDYHEKMEENYIFPLFEKNMRELELVKTLREQHQGGREVTKALERLASQEDPNLKEIVRLMKEFITMYRPHEAREDTILFTQVHDMVTNKEYRELWKKLEDREHELFGEHGFEHMVEKVAVLEKELGIYQLDQFTPRAHPAMTTGPSEKLS